MALFFALFIFVSPSFGGIWTRQYAVAGAAIASSFFVNSTEGYVANGALYKTTRRGTTWEAIPLVASTYLPYGVCFTNNTLYSVGALGGLGGRIRYTTDNGTNWSETDLSDPIYSGIWFADSSNMILTGGLLAGDFRHTTNGGTTWPAITPGLGATYNAHGTSASNIWVSGSTSVAKWNGTAWSASAVPGGANLSGIHAEDANNVWVVGDDGTNGCVFKTTDGGTSWTKVALDTFATIKDIWFINLLEGWAIGNGGVIFHTVNGGGTTAGWTAESAETINNLLSVHFTDANNGWAVGTDGIYKYIVSPEVTSLTPSTGGLGDSQDVVIAGTNFQGTAGSTTDMPALSFGAGVTVNIVTYESAVQTKANISISASAALGTRDVTLTNPDTGAVVKTGAFTISSTTTTTTTTTTTAPTTTLVSTVAPIYPAGNQYWNPDSEGAISLNFTATETIQGTLMLTQIGPPFSTFKRTISIVPGDNKATVSALSDLGGSYPNGIYKVYIFDQNNKKLSQGKIVVYR